MSDSINAAIANPLAGVPQINNPLDVYSKAAGLANAMNQNRLFQAHQAVGEAYNKATDPKTGLVNPQLAQSYIASDPRTSPIAADAATSGQALQTAQQGFNSTQQKAIASAMGSILTLPEAQQTPEALDAAVKNLRDQGVIDSTHYKNASSIMPAPGSPPIAVKQAATQYLVGGLAGPEVAQHVGTTTGILNNGKYTFGVTQSGGMAGSNPGALTPNGPGIGMTTTPEFDSAPERYNDPVTGQPKVTTRAGLLGGNAQTAPDSTLGTGRMTQQPAGSAGVSIGLAPGQQDTIAKEAGQFTQDRLNIPKNEQNVQTLQLARHALELAQTGKSTESVHAFKSFLNAQGLDIGGLTDDVSSYDEARKQLLSYARNQSAAAGHSDAQLEAAEHSNANVGISNKTALDITKLNIGRERQQIAQTKLAPQTGIGYGAHIANFSSSVDPRGFAFDTYSPAERDALTSKMGASEQSKFYRAAGMAQKLGMLNTAPQAAAQAAPAGPVVPTN